MVANYTAPGISARRVERDTTIVAIGQGYEPAIIGLSTGQSALALGEAVVRGAGQTDVVTTLGLADIVGVRTLEIGGLIYQEGIDFTESPAGTIDWLATPTTIPAPAATTPTLVTTGGTLKPTEVTSIVTRADDSDDLDLEGVLMQETVGSVAFWFDVDDSGSTIPAWATAADRAVEVTTIATDDADTVVATKLATAIDGDSEFAATAAGNVVTVVNDVAGVVTDATNGTGTTGFTITTDATIYYVVTAEKVINTTGPTYGETIKSNEVSMALTTDTSKVTLNWLPVAGADQYKIYRADVSGGLYTDTLLTTVVGGLSSTFEDTGALTPASGTPPVSSTATRKPGTGATYYVDVQTLTANNFNWTRYTDINLVATDHGLGSDVYTAAVFILGTAGRGNQSPSLWIAGLPDTSLGSFQAALDLLREKNVDAVIPLSNDLAVATAVKAHVLEMEFSKFPRIAWWGSAIATLPGDASTSGTAAYYAATLNHKLFNYVYPWTFGNVQAADGSITDTELDGHFGAAIAAGRRAGLADRAEPLTNKIIQGVTALGEPGSIPLNTATKDFLAAQGVTILTQEFGNFKVRHAITTDISSFENNEENVISAELGMVKGLFTNFERFKGQKLVDAALRTIERRVNKYLSGRRKLGLIAEYDPQTISAVQSGDQVTTVVVKFEYRPVWSINNLAFNYSFDLSAPDELLAA